MHNLNQVDETHVASSVLHFQALLDALPVMVCTGRADGTGLDFVSQPFLNYAGLEAAQLLGWGWADTVHPDDRTRLMECAASIVTLDKAAETEMRLRRADGAYRWFLFRGAPQHDASGGVVGWCAVNVDIEHQRRSFDSLPGIVCMNTPEGKIEDVNETAVRFYGRSREDLRNWALTVHPDDVPMVVERKAQAVATGEPMDIDVRNLRADGVYRWFHCRSLPFRDSDGRIIRWYSLLTDIDDRKQAEEALRAREREYRSIIDSVPGLVAVWSPEGRTEFVNEQALAYFGSGLADLQKWQNTDVIHPDDLPRVTAAWSESFTTGQAFESEHRLRRSDGTYRWFQVRAVPDRDPDGHIIRWPVLITDVHDRRVAEDERRRSEAFLIEVQRLSRTGGFRFDPVAGKVESSTEIERAYLVQPGDDLSSPEFWFGRIHPDDRMRVQTTFERCVRLRADYRADYRVIRGDGTIGYQHAVGRPVVNANGELVEFIGASMDMTDQWLAAQELGRASQTVNDMQRKLSRATQIATVGELAAAVAHEVNQPLAAVVANGGACLRWLSLAPPNLDKAIEAAERIVKDGKDAGEVVRRVRSLFKRTPVEDVALSINDVIRDVLRLLEADIAKRRVTVATILEPELPAIRGDRVQLQQLLWNLTLNALDAVAAVSDRAKHVSVQSRRMNAQAVVDVTDNGIGISNADAVFEPFFTTKSDGMGMGLTICRSIAAAHRGRLSATRNPDAGTTFSFSLPLAPDAIP
jgi:PAS domain S-box-containing protein